MIKTIIYNAHKEKKMKKKLMLFLKWKEKLTKIKQPSKPITCSLYIWYFVRACIFILRQVFFSFLWFQFFYSLVDKAQWTECIFKSVIIIICFSGRHIRILDFQVVRYPLGKMCRLDSFFLFKFVFSHLLLITVGNKK